MRGVSASSYGFEGISTTGIGVKCNSDSNVGGWFTSQTGVGVQAQSTQAISAYIFRNTATPSVGGPVCSVHQQHVSDTNAAMVVRQYGSGSILELHDGGVTVAIFKDGGDVDIVGTLEATGAAAAVGLSGVSTSGYGVSGVSTSGRGVYGYAGSGAGVHGESDTHHGVQGIGNNSRAGYFYRNVQTPSGDVEVLRVVQDHVSNDDTCVVIQQDGTGNILDLYDGATLEVAFKDGGDVDFTSIVKAGGYKSSDGSTGATVGVAVAKVGGGTRTLNFKDGLYIDFTDS